MFLLSVLAASFFLYLLLFHISHVSLAPLNYECGYLPPSSSSIITGVVSSSNFSRHKRASSYDLKILPYYDTSFTSQSNYAELRKVVEEGISYWQSVLKVRDDTNQFWLNRRCSGDTAMYAKEGDIYQHYCIGGCSATTVCGHVQVPSAHLDYCRYHESNSNKISGSRGAGISGYNFILYISATSDNSQCGDSNLLAYAAHCQLEGKTDRPIAGYINFCPGKVITNGHAFDQQAQFAAQHEILHALGFTISLFSYWRFSNGTVRTPRNPSTGYPGLGFYNQPLYVFQWSNNTIVSKEVAWKSATGAHQVMRHYLVTENVVNVARDHFGCSSLEGVELENQGSIGTALSHWEKRLLQNELMTGIYTHRFSVSKLTLALLLDTGWYIPDYSKANDLSWGKSLGCDFATKSCFEWFRAGNEFPYCNEYALPHQIKCSDHFKVKVHCNSKVISSGIPTEYQYFSDAYRPAILSSQSSLSMSQIGGLLLADYCPFNQEFLDSTGSLAVTSECFESRNQKELHLNYALETFGSSSFCYLMKSTVAAERCSSKTTYRYGAACFKTQCTQSGLAVIIGGQSYVCSDSIITYRITSTYYRSTATFYCPKCSQFCSVCPSSVSIVQPTMSSNIPCTDLPKEPNSSCIFAAISGVYYFFILFILFITKSFL